MSADSIILWALRTHGPRGADVRAAIASPDYAHLRIFHVRRPHEADTALQLLSARFDPASTGNEQGT